MRRFHASILYAIPAVLLLIFFFRLYFPVFSFFMIPDFGLSDVLHQNLPFKWILWQSLHNQEWPLWTNYIGNGFPLLAEGQTGTFFLPNLFFFRFLPFAYAFNAGLISAFLLMTFGMLLFTAASGMGAVAGIFSTVVFVFSGFLAVHLNHYNLIQSAGMMPLILWASLMLRIRPAGKYLLVLSLLLSQQLFAGHMQISLLTMLVATGIVLFYPVRAKKHRITKTISYYCIAVLLGIALAAIQLIPTHELLGQSTRKNGVSFETATAFPYPPLHFLAFLSPYVFGSPADGTYPVFSAEWGIFWENTAYIGLVPLALTVFGLWFSLSDRRILFFVTGAFLSILFVLGKHSPMYFLFSVPPFSFFRVPSRFLLITVLCLAMVSGWTVQKLKETMDATSQGILFALLACFLFLFLIGDEFLFSYRYAPVSPATDWLSPPVMRALVPQGDDMMNWRIASIQSTKLWNAIFLKDGWKDMKPYTYVFNTLAPNSNALASVPSAGIYTGGLMPLRMLFFQPYFNSQEATPSALTRNILSLFSVKYVIAPDTITLPFTRRSSVPSPDDRLTTLTLFENTKAFPRAYLSYNTHRVYTWRDIVTQLSDEALIDERRTLVENDVLAKAAPEIPPVTGSARILSSDSHTVTIEGKSSVPGALVLTDTAYKGWKATLDGKSAEWFTVNGIQRGLVFPAGTHIVQFSYAPASFALGKTISICAHTIVLLLTLFFCVRFRQASPGKRKPGRRP